MPYEWIEPADGDTPPRAELHLWPYRSLPKTGFVRFIGITAIMFLFPISAVLGTPVLWGLLPFILLVTWAIWAALQRSYRDGDILEILRIWDEEVILTRASHKKPLQSWTANPYWVRVTQHDTGGPVPHYLTLKGKSVREVEIGSFLSAEERQQLYSELNVALHSPQSN